MPKWVSEIRSWRNWSRRIYIARRKPYLYYGDLTQQYEIDDYKNKWGDEFNGTIPVKVVIDGYVKYVDCSDCTNNENGYECQNDFMYLLSVDPILRNLFNK